MPMSEILKEKHIYGALILCQFFSLKFLQTSHALWGKT